MIFCSSDATDLFGDADDISASDSDGEKEERKDGHEREEDAEREQVTYLSLFPRIPFSHSLLNCASNLLKLESIDK